MTFISLCEAIARNEGWLVANSRCRRNNNPGNLNYRPWEANPYGAVLEYKTAEVLHPRFALFPTAQDGFDAMSHLLMTHYIAHSLHDLVYDWAPPSDNNDTAKYLADIVVMTGIAPTTILTAELLNAPKLSVA